jgi:hypothetical protein
MSYLPIAYIVTTRAFLHSRLFALCILTMSRWSNKQIIRNGEPVSIRPNVDGDNNILRALNMHGPLTALDICDLTGRTYNAIIHRLQKLKCEPARLIKVHDTQLQNPRVWQTSPQAFHLTKKGETVLLELGIEPKKRGNGHFVHDLAASQTSASFEVGAKAADLEYVQLETKPIVVNQHKIYADGGPVGLGKDGFWRFVFWETDCATEPLTSANKDRQAIAAKFEAYLGFLAQGLYQTIFEIPNATILFTTTTKARLNSMDELLHSMTADYRRCFRFHLLPVITQAAARPMRGWAVTGNSLAPQGDRHG